MVLVTNATKAKMCNAMNINKYLLDAFTFTVFTSSREAS
jgi:hypothetical protein